MLEDPREISQRRPELPKPPSKLRPEVHSAIDEAARKGKPLDHFSARALVSYGLSGATSAHLEALKTARRMKEEEYKKVAEKLPSNLRRSLEKTFRSFLDENYPKPKEYTNYHA